MGRVAIYAQDNSGQIVGWQDAPAPNVTALQEGGGWADPQGVWHDLPTAPSSGGGDSGGGGGGTDFTSPGPFVPPQPVDYGPLNAQIGKLNDLSAAGANPNPTELQGFSLLDKASNLDALKAAYGNYFNSIAVPSMTNQAAVAGQGRSGALTEATALGGASIGANLATTQKQLEAQAAQARLNVGGQLFNRQFLPLASAGNLAGMETGQQGQFNLGSAGMENSFNLGSAGLANTFNLGMAGIDAGLLSNLLNFSALPTGTQTAGTTGTIDTSTANATGLGTPTTSFNAISNPFAHVGPASQ